MTAALTVHDGRDGVREVRRGAELVAVLPPGCRRWAMLRHDGLGMFRPADRREQDELDRVAAGDRDNGRPAP